MSILSPTLRNNVFILNAVLDIAPLYSTSFYTTTMSVARVVWAMVPKIYHFHNVPAILPTLQKRRATVE